MSTHTPPIAVVDDGPQDSLRIGFVELVFALAVGDMAVLTSQLIEAAGTWTDKLPAAAHIILSLVLVAASWVGWRQSVSPGMGIKVKDIVSMTFIGLLLDVGIVIMYFVLLHQVEVDNTPKGPVLKPASAAPEAFWMVVVFGFYAAWDVVTDLLSPDCLPKHLGWTHGRAYWLAFKGFFPSVFASVAAGAMCWAVYTTAQRVGEVTPPANPNDMYRLAAIDAALLAVVVLFRLLKFVERPLAWMLGVGGSVSNTERLPAFAKDRKFSARHGGALVVALLVWLGVIGWLNL